MMNHENPPSAPAPGVYTPPQERSTHGRSSGAARSAPGALPEFGYTDAEWQQRLKVTVEEATRKRDARRAERLEFQRRRAYGLELRHAAKLARNGEGALEESA